MTGSLRMYIKGQDCDIKVSTFTDGLDNSLKMPQTSWWQVIYDTSENSFAEVECRHHEKAYNLDQIVELYQVMNPS